MSAEIIPRDPGKAALSLDVALAIRPASRYEASRSKALELFALRGYGQVSMRDLASQSGMTAGSLYHHFPSKQHLLFELLEEFYEDLGTVLKECMRSRKDRSRVLQRFIRARLGLHQEYPFHSRVAQRDEVSLEGDHRQRIEVMKKRFEDDLMRLITADDPETDPRIDATGHVIAEMIIGLPDWLERHPISETERFRVAEVLIMGAIQGFRLQNAG